MNKKQLSVKKLDSDNLQDVMSLQKKIIDGLHPDEQHFILHRTEEDYLKSLNGESSHMLGVFDQDTLIAQVVYHMPKNSEKRDMPEFKPNTPNEDLVIYEAILVDPAYRGSSLMKRMLNYIEAHALDNGRKHSIIQIAVDNPASWINALHHGMSITKVDLDPSDGAKVIYLEKNIHQQEQKAPLLQDNNKTYTMYLGENIHKKIPSLFMKMQYLISKGYHGVSLNKETQSLVWQKQEKVRTLDYIMQQKQSRAL